ncbi:Sortilin-related receptor [Ophiophagus hannah]|uniref:Sortilin-related receptor n=1 Tax=Ophiophagus hannah TaxID=8665 RepID=V8NHY2_OPHHA|nr:Sortilin-related receptor [Ophiophagus hannah]
MVVHWAGEKSDVIVALARDSSALPGPKFSDGLTRNKRQSVKMDFHTSLSAHPCLHPGSNLNCFQNSNSELLLHLPKFSESVFLLKEKVFPVACERHHPCHFSCSHLPLLGLCFL